MAKNINARIQLKHDLPSNWDKATNFKPKDGELIIYLPEGTSTTPRLKVGYGDTVVSSLPFIGVEFANSADKLTTENVGSSTHPVYFENGVPKATTKSLTAVAAEAQDYANTAISTHSEEITIEDVDTICGALVDGEVVQAVYASREISVPYSPEVELETNAETKIAKLEGPIKITLGEPLEGYDNYWGCEIIQADNVAYEVAIPEGVEFTLGINPVFAAGSITQLVFYYVGDKIRGDWAT